MRRSSIGDYILKSQEKLWEFELERFTGKGQVFCPICEIWHKNNTLCQMPTEGASHEII